MTEKDLFHDGMTFPAPLVLPDDDLALDADAEPQTVQDWRTDEDRNPVTAARKTIYLIPSPAISSHVKPMQRWLNHHGRQPAQGLAMPSLDDACAYVRAFFYGLDVKPLPGTFSWAPWDGYSGTPVSWSQHRSKKARGRQEPTRIGLETPGRELVGVRCRPAPDGASAMQVNLDDVLDALIENVPDDAFAVIMLLDLDMYEADDDDELFTGGRAYGASRIAAVNCFREHPEQLPAATDEAHWWPAAHCAAHVQRLCDEAAEPMPRKRIAMQKKGQEPPSGPLPAAIAAAQASRALAADSPAQKTLAVRSDWFARLMKTATHELGHCLGLDHCVYYACIAQGCASAAESLRQPAYLCPVCLEKVGQTILAGLDPAWMDVEVRREWSLQRNRDLLAVSQAWAGGGMFDGLAAWLNERMK